MATLTNKTKKSMLLNELSVATSFYSRAKGLIGTKNLSQEKGIWFPKTNWIHTFFMSIPIDVIYLDKSFKVKKVDHSLKPWKLASPVFGADSVIEVSAGWALNKNIEIGDLLDVGH
jgi:uncharacterized protein